MTNILHTAFIFWLVLDAVGVIPLFVALLKNYDPKTQRIIIIREMIFALLIMILFLYFGDDFLRLLGISNNSLQIAGGLILFSIALKMLFGQQEQQVVKTEPFIVPLATPILAGPGILTMISVYTALSDNDWEIFIAILIAWIFSLPILLLSSFFKKILGQNGLTAIERLFGYIIVLISIQVILNGIFGTFDLQAA